MVDQILFDRMMDVLNAECPTLIKYIKEQAIMKFNDWHDIYYSNYYLSQRPHPQDLSQDDFVRHVSVCFDKLLEADFGHKIYCRPHMTYGLAPQITPELMEENPDEEYCAKHEETDSSDQSPL